MGTRSILFFVFLWLAPTAFAGNIFDCQFSAIESSTSNAATPAAKSVEFQIGSPETGKKVLVLASGELIFALPNVNGESVQLDFYIGGTCDGCVAFRFYQSDLFEAGQPNSFATQGHFAGNAFAKSIFDYQIDCKVAP